MTSFMFNNSLSRIRSISFRNCCEDRCSVRDLVIYFELYSQYSPSRWIPRGDWGCAADPSGRSVSIHNAAYETD